MLLDPSWAPVKSSGKIYFSRIASALSSLCSTRNSVNKTMAAFTDTLENPLTSAFRFLLYAMRLSTVTGATAPSLRGLDQPIHVTAASRGRIPDNNKEWRRKLLESTLFKNAGLIISMYKTTGEPVGKVAIKPQRTTGEPLRRLKTSFLIGLVSSIRNPPGSVREVLANRSPICRFAI